jgi:hypothetical protein
MFKFRRLLRHSASMMNEVKLVLEREGFQSCGGNLLRFAY